MYRKKTYKRAVIATTLSTILLPILILTGQNLQAQQEKERKIDKISDLLDYEFTIEGVIFAGYEFLDYQNSSKNGGRRLDSAGPADQESGFRVNRAYITLKGKAGDGPFKGWDFRITTDIAPSGEQGDGCSGDNGDGGDDDHVSCKEDNDYNVNLKYAYLTIPLNLLGKNSLRIGQQHAPSVDGQAGVSLQKYWGQRYISKASWDELKLNSSTDRGLAYIHKHDYFGLHFLLGNGEGYHHNNAENIDGGDSHALSLYGMLSAIPTGKNKNFHLSLNFPFHLSNVLLLEDQEARENRQKEMNFKADDGSTPEGYVQQDLKRKQAISYGAELDTQIDLGFIRPTIGLGYALKTVPEAKNELYDQEQGGEVVATQTVAEEQGSAIYGFIHLRWGYVGAFFRLTSGTAASKGDGRLETVNDEKEEGEFTRRLYGVTLFPSPQASFFQVSLGVDDVSANSAIEKSQTEADRDSFSNRQTFIRMQLKY